MLDLVGNQNVGFLIMRLKCIRSTRDHFDINGIISFKMSFVFGVS